MGFAFENIRIRSNSKDDFRLRPTSRSAARCECQVSPDVNSNTRACITFRIDCAHVMVPFFFRTRSAQEKGDHNIEVEHGRRID